MHALLGLFSALALMWMAAPAWAAVDAGRVTFAFGEATITSADGAERAARRGARVYSGDTIATGDGRVQVRFTDGGFVSLVPETTFKIDEYRFEEEAATEDKGLFSLVKGGLRALTGLVGKRERSAYELRTVVATIGIRGTLFRTFFDPDTLRQVVSVGFDPLDPTGGINFTSGGVTLPVNPGGNAVVEGTDAPPRPTTEQADLAAAQPTETTSVTEAREEVEFTAAEALVKKIGEVDIEEIVRPEIPEVPEVPDVPIPGISVVFGDVTYSSSLALAASYNDESGDPILEPDQARDLGAEMFNFYFFKDDGFTGGLQAEVVSDDEGSLDLLSVDPVFVEGLAEALVAEGVPISAAEQEQIDEFLSDPAEVVDVGGDDSGIKWGRWTDGYYLHVFWAVRGDEEVAFTESQHLGTASPHWIVGPQATTAPTNGVARFGFVGGTPSTTESGDTMGEGISSGSIAMDFHTLRTQVDMTVKHQGDISVSTSGSLFENRLGFSTSGSAEGGKCASGCGAFVNGALYDSAGDGIPDGVGASYKLGTGFDHIQGVGAFARESFESDGSL